MIYPYIKTKDTQSKMGLIIQAMEFGGPTKAKTEEQPSKPPIKITMQNLILEALIT